MHAETWLTHTQALDMGFATSIMDDPIAEKPAQNAKKHAFEMLLQAISFKNIDEDDGKKPPVNPDEDDDSGDDDGKGEAKEPPKPPDDSDKNDDSDDEEDEKNHVSKPAQQWSGFFNAIISM